MPDDALSVSQAHAEDKPTLSTLNNNNFDSECQGALARKLLEVAKAYPRRSWQRGTLADAAAVLLREGGAL